MLAKCYETEAAKIKSLNPIELLTGKEVRQPGSVDMVGTYRHSLVVGLAVLD